VAVSVLAGLLTRGPAVADPPDRLLPEVLGQAALPKVVVLSVPLTPDVAPQASALQQSAEGTLARSGRFQTIRAVEALDPQGEEARAKALQDAQAAMKAGQKLYDELDAQKALAQFDRAVAGYEQTDLSVHLSELGAARMMRVASINANGETKAAEQEMERVLAVDPKAEVSPNYFPPEMLSAATRARKAAVSGTSKMDVRSTPPGARVFIDGHIAGVAPFAASGLSSGEHYVTAALEGYKLAQQRARPGTVDLALQDAIGGSNLRAARTQVAQQPDGPGRDRAAVAFGKALGADQVLLLVVRRGVSSQQVELLAIRLEVRDGHNAAYGASTLAVDASFPAGADALLAALGAQDEPRRGGPITHYAGGSARKKVGIGMMVGGGAVAVAGAVFALLAVNQSNAFHGLAQTDPSAPGVASTGKTYALVADVGVIAGLAIAGAGAIVAFTGGSSSSSAAREVPMPPPPPGTAPRPGRGPAKEEPRRSEERRKEDEKRKRDEDKRAREHDADAKRQHEEEERKKHDAETQHKLDEDAKGLREEGERKKHDADSQHKRDEDAKKQRDEDEGKKRDADARRKRDDDTKKQRDADGQRKRDDDTKKQRDAEAQRKHDEDAKKQRDAEAKKKRDEEDRKKKDQQDEPKPPKKTDDEDLRNF
jgi:hypothetical protein